MTVGATPSQTVGPFFSFGLTTREQSRLAGPDDPAAVSLGGRVLDGEQQPVPDAMAEIWHPHAGWGRSGTDAAGEYGFTVPAGAPFLAMLVFARGLMKPLLTRVYFPGDDRNAGDPLLSALPSDERGRLVAQRLGERALRFDIHLQGDRQTPFFVL